MMAKYRLFTILLLSLSICNAYGQLDSQRKQYMLDIHNNARRNVGATNMRKLVSTIQFRFIQLILNKTSYRVGVKS